MSDAPAGRWDRIVAQIQAGDTAGQQALYDEFASGLRLFLLNHLQREDVEDTLHDTLVATISAIRDGQLREPERLAGFVHTIARRQLAGYIEDAVQRRETSGELLPDLVVRSRSPDPEQRAIQRQRMEMAAKVLRALPEVDQEILTRFYWEGQEPELICRDLEISHNQFRVRKSRAKGRFAALARRLAGKDQPAGELLLRKKAASAH